jgi:hypothetical protein
MKFLRTAAIGAALLAGGAGPAMAQNWPGQNGTDRGNDQYQQHTWRDSHAFEQGLSEGRADAQQNRQATPRSERWNNSEDQRDYEIGYNRGYNDVMGQSQNQGNANNSTAYHEGMRAGQWDAQHNRQPRASDSKWSSQRDRNDFQAGYNRGYQEAVSGNDQGMEPYGQYGSQGYGASRIMINSDNTVTWQAPGINRARVFVQVDNQPAKLFAEGKSGRQSASWMEHGHTYTFILRDIDGRELARDQANMR